MDNEEFKKKRDSRTEDLISQIQRHDSTIANIVKSAYERGYADGVDATIDHEPTDTHYNMAQAVAFICGQESVKRPHGKWINITKPYTSYKKWVCSICGRAVEMPYTALDADVFFPFCHCGADMRKETDDE